MRRELTILTALLLVGCTTMDVLDVAMSAGRKMLLGTVEENYSSEYSQVVDNLLDRVIEAGGEGEGAPAAAGSPDAGARPAGAVQLKPIELTVGVAKLVSIDGAPVRVPLADGAPVRDGEGRETRGDDLKISFSVNQRCHIYAVWVDATGWAMPIFPFGPDYEHVNPVEADRSYQLPAEKRSFYLDGYRGIETLYFVASHQALPELEASLSDLLGRTRPVGELPARVKEPVAITRGLQGTRADGAVQMSAAGASQSVGAPAFIARFPESDVVVTRWFRHE